MTEMYGEEFPIAEFDMDFEYDAPRFYDFSRHEMESETEEAELWFEYSGNYPPSPFSLTFNWRNELLKQFTSNNSECHTSELPDPTTSSMDVGLDREEQYNGFIYYKETVSNVPNVSIKSKTKPALSRSSTLMRPTASFLARQNKPLDAYSIQLLRRCQRSLGDVNDKISSISYSMVQPQDTKRQKLENGYLRKVSRLDAAPFVHKIPGKVARVNSNNGRSKVTVPREPNLQTAQRAGRHRSKVYSESEQNVKLSSNSSNRRPANKNGFEASSRSMHKKNTSRSPDFQAFHLKTSQRARQRSSNAKNEPIDESMQENCAIYSGTLKSGVYSKDGKFKRIHSSKMNPKVYDSNICHSHPKTSSKEELCEAMDIKHHNASSRELEDATDTSFRDEPPIESFSKLSIGSVRDFDIRAPSQTYIPVTDSTACRT